MKINYYKNIFIKCLNKNNYLNYNTNRYLFCTKDNKAQYEQKWKDKISNFSNNWKIVAEENSKKNIENIKKRLGVERTMYIKEIAECFCNLNNYQIEYVNIKIKENMMKLKRLTPIEVNTDWPSIAQFNKDCPPVNPEFFKQNELMKDFTEWLKKQEGLDLGLGTSAVASNKDSVETSNDNKATKEEKKDEPKEKQIYDIMLTSYDATKKIAVIKEIRGIMNLGLKESKELVESIPTKLMTNVKKEEIKAITDKLDSANIKWELK